MKARERFARILVGFYTPNQTTFFSLLTHIHRPPKNMQLHESRCRTKTYTQHCTCTTSVLQQTHLILFIQDDRLVRQEHVLGQHARQFLHKLLL